MTRETTQSGWNLEAVDCGIFRIGWTLRTRLSRTGLVLQAKALKRDSWEPWSISRNSLITNVWAKHNERNNKKRLPRPTKLCFLCFLVDISVLANYQHIQAESMESEDGGRRVGSPSQESESESC